MTAGGGIDSYPIEAFSGPLKVFDVSGYAVGRTVPANIFRDRVSAGDIVLLMTRYTPPQTDDALPEVRTLSNEAAEFLAGLPVRAVGTDAFSIDAVGDLSLPTIHQAFLPREIPMSDSDKATWREQVSWTLGGWVVIAIGMWVGSEVGTNWTVWTVVGICIPAFIVGGVIAQMIKDARKSGYDQGHEEGYEEGYEKGLEEGKQDGSSTVGL